MNKVLFNFVVVGTSIFCLQTAFAMEMDVENKSAAQQSQRSRKPSANGMDVDNYSTAQRAQRPRKPSANGMDVENNTISQNPQRPRKPSANGMLIDRKPLQDLTNFRMCVQDNRIQQLEQENQILWQAVFGLSALVINKPF